jgi:hypothetical protein
LLFLKWLLLAFSGALVHGAWGMWFLVRVFPLHTGGRRRMSGNAVTVPALFLLCRGAGGSSEGEDTMGTDVTGGRFAALDAVAMRLGDTGQGLGVAQRPLGAGRDNATQAAGQFAGVLSDACTGFLLAWRETLGVCGESTDLSGQAVRAFREGLRSTDRGYGRGMVAL